MKKIIYLAGIVSFLFGSLAAASSQKDISKEIETIIYAYGKAMNESDVEEVVRLYTKDGVFMPSGLPTAIGKSAIRDAYKHEFEVIDLDMNINIDEIDYNDNIAYVRSRSLGHLTLLANGEKKSTESYRAFFVLKKVQDEWKISRFMFNFSKK